MTTTTLPRLLCRNVEAMAERPAIREKNRGIWQTYTWSQYDREVRDFASGLAALGFRHGDLLAVVGDNRPRLYWAQLAAQCLGGIAVPVYQDSIAAELVYVPIMPRSRSSSPRTRSRWIRSSPSGGSCCA